MGSAAVKIGNDNYVYLLRGSGTYDFYRYNTATDAWDTSLPTAPGGVSTKPYKNGSSITYDGNDTIYCLKGSYNEFAAYSISGRNWATKDPLPLVGGSGTRKKKVKDGSGTAYAGKTVYALKGGNTNEFWTYRCDSHRWTTTAELTPGSKRVKGGGALVAALDVNALYAFRGNNTREFWQYGPVSADGLQLLADGQSKNIQGNSSLITHRFSLSVTPNPSTSSLSPSISYSLPVAGTSASSCTMSRAKLVNTLASGYHPAGSYSSQLSANGSQHKLAMGIYVLNLEAGGRALTRKLILE